MTRLDLGDARGNCLIGFRRGGKTERTHEVEKYLPLAFEQDWRAGHFHKPCPVTLLQHGTKYSGRFWIVARRLKIDQ